MFIYAQEDPVYAQDFFNHLVEEGALGEKIGEDNGREIEPCEQIEKSIASKGERQKEKVEHRNHD